MNKHPLIQFAGFKRDLSLSKHHVQPPSEEQTRAR